MVSSGTGRPTFPSTTTAKIAAYPQCSTKSVSGPIDDRLLPFVNLLQPVHRIQLRSSRRNEVAWRPGAIELHDDVGEAAGFLDRSPLEDRPLRPVPGPLQVRGRSLQPRLISFGDSELQLSSVVTPR